MQYSGITLKLFKLSLAFSNKDLGISTVCKSWSQNFSLIVQWNPVTLVANGPQKSGCIKGMAELKGFCK